MQISLIAITVSVCGAVGGFVNALLSWGFRPPRQVGNTYRPGWMANVLTGAVAAFVLWCLFDPSSSASVIGDGTARAEGILSVGDVVASVAVGIAAARIFATGGEKPRLAT